MSRPVLSPEAQFYLDTWATLNSEQAMFSHGLGMAGGVLLHQRISRRVARREGASLGYDGEALLDFIETIRRIDALRWSANFQRQAEDMAAAAKKNSKTGGKP